MAERGNSVFDAPKEKRSLVADIMVGAGKGMLSNLAGIADLAVMSPTVAYKTIAKGQDISTATRGSSGLISNALGLSAPDRNTPEGFAYNTAQILTPLGKPVSRGAYRAEVTTNAAADALAEFGSQDPTLQMAGITGLMGASMLGNKARNKMIEQLGYTPEAAAAAKKQGLTLGQYTENPNALRTEADLLRAPKTADRTAKFFKQQNEGFKASLDTIVNKINTVTTATDTQTVRKAFKDLEDLYANRQTSLSNKYGDDIEAAFALNKGAEKKFAPMKGIIDTIDQLIVENKTLSGTDIDANVVKQLEKMRTNLQAVKGGYFTMNDFVKEYKNWSQKSFNNRSFIDGLDSDSSRAINSKMAKAFEETLDGVIDNPANLVNKKAAEKLVQARAEYKAAKQETADYAAQPVNKLFNVQNVYELDGQQVIDAISNMKPEARQSAIRMLNVVSPDITVAVRRKILDDLVQAGVQTGKGSAAPSFNSTGFLKAVEEKVKKDPYIKDFIFNNAEDAAGFESRLQAAKKIANTNEVSPIKEGSAAIDAAGELGSLFGGYKSRVFVRGISGAIKDTAGALLLSDKKLFDILFKGKDVRRGIDTAINRGLTKSMVSSEQEAAAQQRRQDQGEAATQELLSPTQPEEDLSYDAYKAAQEQNKSGEGVQPAETQLAPPPMQQPQQAPVEAPMQPEDDLSYDAYLRSKKGM